MISDRPRGLAVHVCADVPSPAGHLRRSPVRSGRDTLTRMSRLCVAAGIQDQHQLCLVGEQATTDHVRAALTHAAREIDPNGLLVLTFTGHSDRRQRDERGARITQWCLFDGEVRVEEIARLLGAVAPSVRVIVIADTCYAGAFARFADVSCTLVLLGACAENQTKISGTTSEFAVSLEKLVYPAGVRNPSCISYRWLEGQLQQDTPDAERPHVWTNRPAAWAHRPFELEPPGNRDARGSSDGGQHGRQEVMSSDASGRGCR